jgi:hypothetical protein
MRPEAPLQAFGFWPGCRWDFLYFYLTQADQSVNIYYPAKQSSILIDIRSNGRISLQGIANSPGFDGTFAVLDDIRFGFSLISGAGELRRCFGKNA